jgi:hypothetical protein
LKLHIHILAKSLKKSSFRDWQSLKKPFFRDLGSITLFSRCVIPAPVSTRINSGGNP